MPERAPTSVVEWSPGEYSVFDHNSNVVQSGSNLSELCQKLKGQTVVLALSRKACFVRSVRLPDLPKAELEKVLAIQMPNFVPIEGQDIAVDFVILDDLNSEGRLVMLCALKSEVLRQAMTEVESAGLKVGKVVPSAASSLDADWPNGAIVSSSGSNVAIDILENGSVKSSRLIAGKLSKEEMLSEVSLGFSSVGVSPGPITTMGSLTYPGVDSFETEPLQRLSENDFGFSLQLPEVRAKQELKKAQQSKNFALLLWVAALGVGAVVFDIRSDQQALIAKGEKTWTKRTASLKSANSATQKKSEEIRKKRELVEAAFEPTQPLGDVLTVLTNLAPDKLWLSGLSLERGKRATLRGTSMNSQLLTTYLASLGKQSRMRDVKLIFANNAVIEKTPVVNFSISSHIVGNFPIPQDKTAGKKS